MNKSILIALVVIVLLVIAVVFFSGREKRHSFTLKGPSGKTATVSVN